MKTGNFCPSSYKLLQKIPNLRNYIFAILKDNTVKLGLFINFKVLFSAVSMVLRYLAYIEISDYRDKAGLLRFKILIDITLRSKNVNLKCFKHFNKPTHDAFYKVDNNRAVSLLEKDLVCIYFQHTII